MAVTAKELDSFHRFGLEKIDNGGADLTLEDLVDLWRAQHPTDEELEASLTSLPRGLADAEAGRVYPATEVLDYLRTPAKHPRRSHWPRIARRGY